MVIILLLGLIEDRFPKCRTTLTTLIPLPDRANSKPINRKPEELLLLASLDQPGIDHLAHGTAPHGQGVLSDRKIAIRSFLKVVDQPVLENEIYGLGYLTVYHF